MTFSGISTQTGEVLVRVGQGTFYRMPSKSRPARVYKHFLNYEEAWWHLNSKGRTWFKAWIENAEELGVVCGPDHVRGPLPKAAWLMASTLHDKEYEPLIRIVLEDFAERSSDVIALSARCDHGRLCHTILLITVIYDPDGVVRTAYRSNTHPASSDMRQMARNFVRRALLRASLSADASSDRGVSP